MKPSDLIVRCYAERIDGQWQAFCLDFCLASQGESFPEVRLKLESQLVEYVREALVGHDKQFGPQLLRRRAPLPYWIKYYAMLALWHVGALRDGVKKLFEESIPLEPKNYKHA